MFGIASLCDVRLLGILLKLFCLANDLILGIIMNDTIKDPIKNKKVVVKIDINFFYDCKFNLLNFET